MLLIIFIPFNPILTQASAQLPDINGSFERDANYNGLPDFWESNWRNGTSTGPSASLASYDPKDGYAIYRMYNGIGDAGSHQYVLSERIPITGGRAYQVEALMRYGLQAGGKAHLDLIQLDSTGREVAYKSQSYQNGGWVWRNNLLTFMTAPKAAFLLIRFAVGGEERAYLDLDKVRLKDLDINGSFEQDEDQNGLPDFWETNWRKGNSQGPYAKLVPFDPASGSKAYRLHNGIGDKNSYHYVLSNPIPVVGGRSYELSVLMKYGLQNGGTAGIHLIQLDSQGNELGMDVRSYSKGNWMWNKNILTFTAKANTSTVLIRIEVGGEEAANLDLDNLLFKELDLNGSFEQDEDQNGLPDFWETNWRNGNSQRSGVSLVHAILAHESKVYRMTNGTGEPSSYQYVLSNQIPVAGNSTYSVKALLKFGFAMNQSTNNYSYDVSSKLSKSVAPDGRIQHFHYDENGNIIRKMVSFLDQTKVEMSVIELDSTNKVINETHLVLSQGNGGWMEKEIMLTTRGNTNAISIRFGVGNEDGATVDIDNVRLDKR